MTIFARVIPLNYPVTKKKQFNCCSGLLSIRILGNPAKHSRCESPIHDFTLPLQLPSPAHPFLQTPGSSPPLQLANGKAAHIKVGDSAGRAAGLPSRDQFELIFFCPPPSPHSTPTAESKLRPLRPETQESKGRQAQGSRSA